METELLERCVSSRRQEREMAFWFCFGKHQQGRGCACVSFISFRGMYRCTRIIRTTQNLVRAFKSDFFLKER